MLKKTSEEKQFDLNVQNKRRMLTVTDGHKNETF